MIALINPLEEKYQVFFFFPFYHTGGAEKFNAAVSNAAKDRKALIVFTRKSINTTFLEDFRKSGHRILDISRFTDNKWVYFLNLVYRGIITGHINRQQNKCIVFNGQCNFAYKISPWVKKEIIQLEFIHTFNSFSYIRTPFIPFYHKTISSSKKTINDHIKAYKEWNVPSEYAPRFEYILYGIALPPIEKRPDLFSPVIRVLFVGRGTAEKRVHLVAAMAQKSKEQNLSVAFDFMGDVKQGIPAELLSFCNLLGSKSDISEIYAIYRRCHILVVSSAFEGFPFVVMEAMSQGLAILSTPVGDVPYHVKNETNGYIIPELDNELKIVEEGVEFIKKIGADRDRLQQMSMQNQEEAYAKFELSVFNKNYKQLFDSLL